VQSFDELIAEFIATPKIVVKKPRWRSKSHPDFATLTLGVVVEGKRHLRGRIAVSAHRLMMPPKYSFSLLFRGRRVLALDVNPKRSHRNLLRKGSISSTHWQRWPAMDAEPEYDVRTFSVWLYKFFNEANVTCEHRVGSPPRGRQLDLPNDLGPVAR